MFCGFELLAPIIGGGFFWIGTAILCGWIARERGRDWLTWGIIGLFLGIIAIIILLVMDSNKKPTTSAKHSNLSDLRELKTLLDDGAITQDEYETAKNKILNDI